MLHSLILTTALASTGHAFPLPEPPAADVAAVLDVCRDYLEGQLAAMLPASSAGCIRTWPSAGCWVRPCTSSWRCAGWAATSWLR